MRERCSFKQNLFHHFKAEVNNNQNPADHVIWNVSVSLFTSVCLLSTHSLHSLIYQLKYTEHYYDVMTLSDCLWNRIGS